MAGRQWSPFLLLLGFLVGGSHGSAGDVDPTYRACVDQCEKTGSWKQLNCRGSHGSVGDVDPTYRACVDQCEKTGSWKQLNCRGDCSYYCMMQREKERATLGLSPVKYHGKWPFKRTYVFQAKLPSCFLCPDYRTARSSPTRV
ncbi:hypothetical protein KSP40_PGU004425 [Platanthera guangdongensis]|uniref:Post-GPI attachment to proteins factor 3 n=1 Tax=Platanthera guangdongensis TaxID=2320717 RepID=A0ABR2LIB3_9ASPA